ncbi:MAG: hypothetical protein JW751_23510 [Polyangiaceae bacterium]|nr:hypothetical protein [Polyangiaceae bacterium]
MMGACIERRSKWIGAALSVGAAVPFGCDRDVEIYDAPAAPTVTTTTVPDAGSALEVVEVDFEAPENVPCEDRAYALCEGGTDWPCMPEVYIDPAIENCFSETGCRVDGWVEVDFGDDHCAEELRMEDPDPEFVSCLVARLTAGRCSCAPISRTFFLGVGNDGC